MKVEFHPEARLDFDEAFDWYAKRSFSAAANFSREVDACLLRIADSPERFAKLDEQHRRCLLHKFPYHVVYRINPEVIEVIAVAHGARKPRFWKDR